jgi:hypothetical protein
MEFDFGNDDKSPTLECPKKQPEHSAVIVVDIPAEKRIVDLNELNVSVLSNPSSGRNKGALPRHCGGCVMQGARGDFCQTNPFSERRATGYPWQEMEFGWTGSRGASKSSGCFWQMGTGKDAE